MSKPKRIAGQLTTEQQARLRRNRRRIACELPKLHARDQMRREASDEQTLTGDLRRTIHASALSLADIAAKVQIPVLTLDEFLTGERTLRSDVLDRLAGSMGLELVEGQPKIDFSPIPHEEQPNRRNACPAERPAAGGPVEDAVCCDRPH